VSEIPVEAFVGRATGRAMVQALAATPDLFETAGPMLETIQRHLLPDDQGDDDGAGQPGLDPISAWVAAATGSAAELPGELLTVPLASGNLGVAYQPHAEAPGCVAWHDDYFACLAVPADLDRVVISYAEGDDAAFDRDVAVGFLRSATQSGERRAAPARYETNIEWFAFVGGNTLSSHGSESLENETGRGAGSAEIETGGRAGVLLLRPWQWAGSRLEKTAHDPLFQERLATHLRAAGTMADVHPEVGDLPHDGMGSSMVWVHGTVSCGLAAVPQLVSLVPTRVHRFEHDTFQDIDTNAAVLADTLDTRLKRGSKLLLVGHSRGGLVSRVAANVLTAQRDDLDITVLTLGTPHLGTPIVNAGDRALRALVSITKFGLRSVPDPATMLLKYLLRYAELPTGISDMAVDSPWLRGLRSGGRESYTLLACGADYQRGAQPESSGVKALGRLHRLFEAAGTPNNDLVVSTASAIGRGTPVELDESLGHFQYLRSAEVKRQLAALRPGPFFI